MRWLHSLLLVLTIALFIIPIQADEPIRTDIVVILREGPGQLYERIETINEGIPVEIEQRNQIGDWFFVTVPDMDLSGWVPSGFLRLPEGFQVMEVPLDETTVAFTQPQFTAEIIRGPLNAVPLVTNITDTSREIFHSGQLLGRNPQSVVKVGDCNSISEHFLTPFSTQATYELGPYGHLQETVDYFSGTLGRQSITADVGFNAFSVLSSFWADDSVCNANESPLACEYRVQNPAVALIMFGTNDLTALNTEDYETALRTIIETSIDAGVIPVLSTFPNNPELSEQWYKALQYNVIIVELAMEYDIPLMNFWRMSQSLPKFGIAEDNAHLTVGGATIKFGGGAEMTWGFTARNLLTLHLLHELRQDVLLAEPVIGSGD